MLGHNQITLALKNAFSRKLLAFSGVEVSLGNASTSSLERSEAALLCFEDEELRLVELLLERSPFGFSSCFRKLSTAIAS